ncbi:MAG: putative toxin-antitoxin system toxin component, PIN family [Chloroflexi bacterium]|nr:putative toxin-antitoxin system toxin component, PIN family [Chloroflexota bacterium]MDL1941968.1 putative toxin-antitoxin system toxin component, PIN family [Chloroflexi bacterium CFX2]
MKAIIDTNVLLSAAWKNKTPEEVVLWIATQEDWEWVVSEAILSEYREVLRREKFGMASEILERWEFIISRLTTLVDINVDIEFPRDQKDAKFLACALISKADYFITGDKDFGEAKKIMTTTIISVSTFKNLFIQL